MVVGAVVAAIGPLVSSFYGVENAEEAAAARHKKNEVCRKYRRAIENDRIRRRPPPRTNQTTKNNRPQEHDSARIQFGAQPNNAAVTKHSRPQQVVKKMTANEDSTTKGGSRLAQHGPAFWTGDGTSRPEEAEELFVRAVAVVKPTCQSARWAVRHC